jgi:hypothetical protein
MTEQEIEKYGNELVITGMVVGNGDKTRVVMFPESDFAAMFWQDHPTEEELKQIFFQLDNVEITNSQKVVLRKSQRNLDAVISWNVFRRDGYRCAYCGNDHTPLTIDHLVLWEEMGDTVEGNLLTACKKCNHTRGNQSVPDFLNSDYYMSRCYGNTGATAKLVILGMYNEAVKLPLRKPRKR